MNWYKQAQVEDFDVPTMPFKGMCYHGSTFRGSGDFDNLISDYSDYGAIWVCPEERIAEIFATDWRGGDGIPVVFKVNVDLKNAANMRPYNMGKWAELLDALGYSDIRELIPFLEQKGCDGWVSYGSIDFELYADIAVFSSNLSIQEAKIKLNDQWTEYMTLDEAKEQIESVVTRVLDFKNRNNM